MKKHFLSLSFFLVIMICGISNAQDAPLKPSILLAPAPTETTRSVSVFEGRYKVGNTTCDVTPIKMAFDVKWAKGKGRMTFFFDKTTSDGKIIFVSEPQDKGRDTFVFNDDHYDVGLFIRADGKVFAVKK